MSRPEENSIFIVRKNDIILLRTELDVGSKCNKILQSFDSYGEEYPLLGNEKENFVPKRLVVIEMKETKEQRDEKIRK